MRGWLGKCFFADRRGVFLIIAIIGGCDALLRFRKMVVMSKPGLSRCCSNRVRDESLLSRCMIDVSLDSTTIEPMTNWKHICISVKILIFYIIFYLCLAAFWALMLLIFYQTIDQRVPKWQLEDSRIGSNPGMSTHMLWTETLMNIPPGLGFRPRPRDENVESTLIWFKQGANENNWKHWTDSLNKFLERELIIDLIPIFPLIDAITGKQSTRQS